MTAGRERFQGLIGCLTTDFCADGSLDLEMIASNAGKLVEGGAHGIYCLGATGEGYSVSDEEFRTIVDTFVQAVAPPVLKIVGCYSPSLNQVIDRATYAQSAGADAILFVPPYYVPLNRRERLACFERLAAACPDLGIIHYNTGNAPRVALDAEDYAALQEIPNVWGSKQVLTDFETWLEFCRRSPELVHMPLDSLFVPSMMFGGKGIFSELPAMAPKFGKELWAACTSGDWERAKTMQHTFQRWGAELYTPLWAEGYSYIALDKAFYGISGNVRSTPPRPPLQAVPDAVIKDLRVRMEKEFPELLHA